MTVVGGKAKEQRQPLLVGGRANEPSSLVSNNEAVVSVSIRDDGVLSSAAGASVGGGGGGGGGGMVGTSGMGGEIRSSWRRSPAVVGVVAVTCLLAAAAAGVIALGAGGGTLSSFGRVSAAALGDQQQQQQQQRPVTEQPPHHAAAEAKGDDKNHGGAAATENGADADYSSESDEERGIASLGGPLEQANRRAARAARRKAKAEERAAAALAGQSSSTKTTEGGGASGEKKVAADDDKAATAVDGGKKQQQQEKKQPEKQQDNNNNNNNPIQVAGKKAVAEVGQDATNKNAAACKIIYYYHIPKTGGGSIVRYFGHTEGVNLLRYESTMYVPVQNKTLYYWEHQSNDAHWDNYIVPQSLKPGLNFIAHHWGRYGMLQMRKRLMDLRAKAAAKGCEFMASTTLREPVERDVSDEVFRRITGVSTKSYLGDEQLRFFLINSQHTSPQCPANFADDEALRDHTLAVAKRMLTKEFELVAVIEDLEHQKDAFLQFFGFPTAAAITAAAALGQDITPKAALGAKQAAAAAAAAPSDSSESSGMAHLGRTPEPLGHVHKIDYAKQGVTPKEMKEMRARFRDKNTLDSEIYVLAQKLSRENEELGSLRDAAEKAVAKEGAKEGAKPVAKKEEEAKAAPKKEEEATAAPKKEEEATAAPKKEEKAAEGKEALNKAASASNLGGAAWGKDISMSKYILSQPLAAES